MFTGIIEEIGVLKRLAPRGRAYEATIGASTVLEGTKVGDSIATNGVCLTVTSMGEDYFTADVMPQTVKLSSFHALTGGSPVNLERALPATGRLDGHIVQGHVDGVGTLVSIQPTDQAHIVTIRTESKLFDFMVNQGSIALDGISLTLVEVKDPELTVSIIPTTGKDSTLLRKRPGDLINIECDIVGKYIYHMVHREKAQTGVTESFLREHGFL